MQNSLVSSFGKFSLLLLLLPATIARVTAAGSVTITNVPTLGGSFVEVNTLGAAGQIGGGSSLPGDEEVHAFIYGSGGIVDLGTLGGTFGEVRAINASGQAVGFATIAGDTETHAFRFNGGPLADMGTLGGTTSIANAINDAGQVTGNAYLSNNNGLHAFLDSGGTMTDLGSLGGNFSMAVGINSSGVVIGNSYTPQFNSFGFIFEGSGMVPIGDLGAGYYSSARSINDSGMVVGESGMADGDIHTFLYSAGQTLDLGALDGFMSSPIDINDNGLVIGTYYTIEFNIHGFIYSNGVMSDLGTLGGFTTLPVAVNNSNQVVGSSDVDWGITHAFLWQDGVLTDLNSLLPDNSGWVLENAQFINDAGRIVGYGTLNGEFQWFIMDFGTPVANNPPVAVATPASQIVDCHTPAVLSGAASSDPDGDSLAYRWSEGSLVLGVDSTLAVSLPTGSHTLTLKVTDPSNASSETNVLVQVVDTNAPVIVGGPPPVTISADATGQGAVPNVVPGIVATDNCTPSSALVITQNPTAGTPLGVGSNQIVVTVTDASGNSVNGSTHFIIADTTPPVIQSVSAAVGAPPAPNSKLLPVTISVVAIDNCDATPENKIVAIQCNSADGESVITGNLTANLAPPKKAKEIRVYTITVLSTDDSGNSTSANIKVTLTKRD